MGRRHEARGATARRSGSRSALAAWLLASLAVGFVGGALARRAGGGGSDGEEIAAPAAIGEMAGRPETPSRPPAQVARAAEERFQSGYAHLQAGHYGEAVAEFEKAAALDPTDPRPHHASGKAYQEMLWPERAEESFRNALRADPLFLESKKELAKILHDRGSYREAIALLEPLVPRYPDDNFLRGELAVNLLRAGEVKRAVELLEAYNRAAGADAWGHTNLGLAYEEDGQLEKAEAEYRRALRIDSTSSTTYFRLGNLLAASGRDDEAKRLLESYRRLRELENVEHQLKTNLLREPDHVPTLVRLAEVQFRRGRKREALATLERARAVAPDDRPLAELHAKVRAEVEGRR